MEHLNKPIPSNAELPSAQVHRLLTGPTWKSLLFLFAICLTAAYTRQTQAQALGADNSRRYDQNAYLESHNAYATPSANYICWIYCNQDRSINDQLDAGVRSLDLRIWKVRQFKYAEHYQARIYNDDGRTNDTFDNGAFISNGYEEHEPEIVLGHHLWESGLGYLLGGLGYGSLSGALHPLENYSDRLQKIVNWLVKNPNEVVTLNVSSSVPEGAIYMTQQAFDDIGFSAGHMFILGDYVNLGLPPRQGRAGGLRPQPDGWWFPMDGMPTLQYLVTHHKRVVYHDGRTFENTPFNDVFVGTIYGNHSVPKDCSGNHFDDWANVDPDHPRDIDDFTVPLFLMQHVREDIEFTHDETKCVQGLEWLKNRFTDIENRWHRLPNFLRVDQAAKTTEVSGASNNIDGPKEFVTYLNQRWAEQPTIKPTHTLSVQPNKFGWNNTDVTVRDMWGESTDTVRKVVYGVFGTNTMRGPAPAILLKPSAADYPAFTTVSGEGKFVVSFYAVGSQGNTSDRGYIDIWIDKTPPTIFGELARQPNTYGWYNSDVTGYFNFLDETSGPFPDLPVSGIDVANSTPKVVLSTEGKDQAIIGRATDNAGNVKRRALEGINLDKTPPTIVYTGNAGNFTADQFINITCTPEDNLSGVRVSTCQNISGQGYDFVLGTQMVTQHAYSAQATDFADNVGSGATSFTVTVNQQAVSNLTARFVSDTGVANSLQQKLRQAAEAQARGDLKAKARHVDVYIHELQNHIGRFVSAQNAEILIRLAQAF
jgi:hypothetical protein